MNVCPDCDNPLPQTATSCEKCHWSLPRVIVADKTRDDLEAEDLAERTARAREWMAEHGIAERLPNETPDEFRRRTLTWLRENARKIGRAA